MAYLDRDKFLKTKDPTGYIYSRDVFKGDYSEWLSYIQGVRINAEFRCLQEETKAVLLVDLTKRLIDLSVKSAPACKLLFEVLGDSSSPVGRPKGSKRISKEHQDKIEQKELSEYGLDLERLDAINQSNKK
jgi:hypothetical protein|tara:strand:- start:1722 stop:2114 length:393 start_codon:yes stop_codon:yes gene_type:complete